MSITSQPLIMLASTVGLGLLGFFAYAIWWQFGHGSLERRKRVRRQLWMKYQLEEIGALGNGSEGKTKTTRSIMGRFKRLDKLEQKVDRDAYEREVRRWD